MNGTWHGMRSYGLSVSASYPFSRFTRLDFGITPMAMSRENVDIPTQPTLDRFVLIPEVSYIIDDAIMGFWAPVKGRRWNFTVEASPPIGSNGLAFATFRADLREYFSLGTNYTIALRGSGGISMGRDPQKFFIGGVDNWFNRFFSDQGWPFVNPEDFAFTRQGLPLRGFAINERNGSSHFIANAEFRFPLLVAFQAGPIPALLQGLQGQVFMDIGGAWDENGNAWSSIGGVRIPAPDPILYSLGLGVRSLALGLPLRFDVAWRHEPTGSFSRPIYLFSLGGDF